MPSASAPPQSDRDASGSPNEADVPTEPDAARPPGAAGSAASTGSPGSAGRFDPLAETVKPGPADVAVTRRLSRPGARRAEPKPADPPGYRLRHLLGRGGFGAVWLATESATGKQVAVKTFRHVRALDWPLLTREVEKLAALDASRHVVQLLGVGWEADPPYYVMEYLPDGSLADLLAGPSTPEKSAASEKTGAGPGTAAKREPLSPKRAAELAEGIAAGLVHAHGSGILHCDLKPGNVLLDRDGVPRLCDFGQARGVGGNPSNGTGGTADDSASEARTGGRPLGTLFYMPPEQVAADAAPDARWDVYALGAVLYEMLTGDPPHRTEELSERLKSCPPGERLDAYREAVVNAPAPTGHHHVRGVDGPLARIVDRCLKPDPADRYPNAQAVRTALRQRSEDAVRRSRARWGLLGPAAVAAMLLLVGAVIVNRTLETGRGQVIARAKEANALSAGLVARSLEREVQRKQISLEQIAAAPRLAELVENAAAEEWKDGPAVEALGDYLSRVTPKTFEFGGPMTDGLRDAVDTSWFLQDATGVTRWRKPFDGEVVNRNFVWRDYFHGLPGDLPRDTEPGEAAPIEATHLSLPYFSTSTFEWKLAFSTPVRNEEGRVVGVLARTVVQDALLAEYDSTKRGITGEGRNGERLDEDEAPRFDRVIALFDRQSGELLDHPWLAGRPDATVAEKQSVCLPPDQRTALEAAFADDRLSYRTEAHADPAANAAGGERFAGPWIAAFAPVRGTDWVVVVQEPHRDALRLMESFRGALLKVGAVLAGGVLLTLGGLLFWFTRDRATA
ncbi:serine/threonine protein kinase [Alienimonas chondri]|uniref:Serine/threonine-protein kinase PknD n=1 Tax=Alienimonas chondri TaxID=2681879 RepID=A0ABX1VE61_9PLAN|nr:serine/threonine protein kinase [Alienimonas chondri]NNJ26029.1 Serine/threonine-protein kinase PknD [Alienimonas chondri]